jgi:hypothetical protein
LKADVASSIEIDIAAYRKIIKAIVSVTLPEPFTRNNLVPLVPTLYISRENGLILS